MTVADRLRANAALLDALAGRGRPLGTDRMRALARDLFADADEIDAHRAAAERDRRFIAGLDAEIGRAAA